MIKRFIELLGFRLYCVTFTMVDVRNNYVGMFSILCYAESKGCAKRRARKRLNKVNIMFSGNWIIDAEEI